MADLERRVRTREKSCRKWKKKIKDEDEKAG